MASLQLGRCLLHFSILLCLARSLAISLTLPPRPQPPPLPPVISSVFYVMFSEWEQKPSGTVSVGMYLQLHNSRGQKHVVVFLFLM